MQQTIAELITATEIAERAIAGLKATVREADETLGERLKAAERFSHRDASRTRRPAPRCSTGSRRSPAPA